MAGYKEKIGSAEGWRRGDGISGMLGIRNRRMFS